MAQGLQVWDANGILQLDTSRLMGRFLTVIDASAPTGAVDIAGLNTGTGFAVPLSDANPEDPNQQNAAMCYPVCSFSGNTISWSRPDAPVGWSRPSCQLLVGVK